MAKRGVSMAFVFLLLLSFASATPASQTEGRPEQWAQPLARTGLPNLHQVTATIFRSAQPDIGGLPGIESLGVRTVLSLRASDTDAKLDARSDLRFLRHPLYTWSIDDADVLGVLRVLTDPARQPVLLHCKHGADRTGLMIASYRVVVQDWSKQAALDEMKHGGYGFHPMWRNIERRLLALDVAALKSALAADGTTSPTP